MPVAFEIERFDWSHDDRLEVTGRWFDVAGRRFIRPTLHVRVSGRRRRLIALLDEKPWAPDDPTWLAAFAWKGPHTGVTAARLEVSPDLVLDLPAPGRGAAGKTLTPRPRPKRPAPKPAPPREEPPPVAESPPPAPAESPSPPADSTPSPPAAAPAPPPAADRPSSPGLVPHLGAPDVPVRVLERRLVARESALRTAHQEIAALRSHQASAVERARDVVRLEGELVAAQGELADARAELAQPPIDVKPLERRFPIRRREWGRGTRVAVVVALLVLFALFVFAALSFL